MAYTKTPPLGQNNMAGSLPVTVASDQSAVPVTVSGGATAANQTTIIGHLDGVETSLTAIDADLGATSDAASTVGGTGSLNAKTRLMTTQLDAIQTAVQLIDNAIAGTEMQVDVVAALPTGSNTIGNIGTIATSVTPGTAAANLGKARDAVAGASDTAVPNLFVRRDTPTAVTPAAGDYEVPQISANGEQWVRLQGEVADDAAFTVGTTRTVPSGFLADETATDSVDEGDAGAARMTLDRKQIVTLQPHTAGGLTTFRTIDLDETEEEVKATAGNLYGYYFANTTASARYLKLYNATAASVSVGTTTPSHTFYLPPTSAGHVSFPVPIGFSTALCAAATTGVADSDTGAPGANDVLFMAFYF